MLQDGQGNLRRCKGNLLDNENTFELFEAKGILNNLCQGELSVTQYFNTLNRYWQQIDLFDNATPGCLECNLKYKKIVKKERIFKLLFGLNKNQDEVRGRILIGIISTI